jgi:hypothetical protein
MSRNWFGPGLTGELATRIQNYLVAAGAQGSELPGFVDGDFGDKTERALKAYQIARVPTNGGTGMVDDDTWAAVAGGDPVPSLFERCLGLTAWYEGTNYTGVMGDWDGAGITWGIIGFTLQYGELQGLLSTIEAQRPGTLDACFPAPLLDTWKRQTASSVPLAAQVSWALGISVAPRFTKLQPAWEAAFNQLGQTAVARQAQQDAARKQYFAPALISAQRLGFRSELGIALCFDCHVQDGGIAQEVIDAIVSAGQPEPDARLALAKAIAGRARPKFQADVLARKTVIANGGGPIRGAALDLSRWGLADVPA